MTRVVARCHATALIDADLDTLAPTLIGAVHLLFADRNATPPEAGAVRKMVTTVLAGALPR